MNASSWTKGVTNVITVPYMSALTPVNEPCFRLWKCIGGKVVVLTINIAKCRGYPRRGS